MVEWSRIVDGDRGVVQWADVELFDACVARGVELTSEAEQRRLDARPFSEQRAAVREAWRMCSAAYRALDLPAAADYEYLRRKLGAYNATDEADEQRIPGDPRGVGDWYLAGARLGYVGAERSDNVEVATCGLHWDTSEPILTALDADPAWWVDRGSAEGYARALEVQSRPGDTWAVGYVSNDCVLRPNALGACDRYTVRFLPPALWEFWLVGSLLRSLQERGAMGVILQSRAYALARNISTARVYGVLQGREDFSALGPEADRALAVAREGTGQADAAIDILLSVAGAAVALGGPAGVWIGGIIAFEAGVMWLFTNVFPQAVAHGRDGLGRELPAMTKWRISGGVGEGEPPTHQVQEPPGFVRRRAAPARRPFVLSAVVVPSSSKGSSSKGSSSSDVVVRLVDLDARQVEARAEARRTGAPVAFSGWAGEGRGGQLIERTAYPDGSVRDASGALVVAPDAGGSSSVGALRVTVDRLPWGSSALVRVGREGATSEATSWLGPAVSVSVEEPRAWELSPGRYVVSYSATRPELLATHDPGAVPTASARALVEVRAGGTSTVTFRAPSAWVQVARFVGWRGAALAATVTVVATVTVLAIGAQSRRKRDVLPGGAV